MEQVITRENISTVRVVSFILTQITCTKSRANASDPQAVAASYDDLAQATHTSRYGVIEGVKRALEVGYLRLVHQGGPDRSKSCYTINWLEEFNVGESNSETKGTATEPKSLPQPPTIQPAVNQTCNTKFG